MNQGIYEILNLDLEFFDNINKVKQQNLNEEIVGYYKNLNPPNFKRKEEPYLIPNVVPNITYKNKSMFGVVKPIQTEEDEIGQNQAFLNNYYGYYDYGYYKVQNQSINQKPKKTPINNIYEKNI